MAESVTPPTPATVAAHVHGFSGVTPDTVRHEVADYLSASVDNAEDTTSVVGLFGAAHDVLTNALDAVEDELD